MSKKILIDARLYGLENAGLGRYTMNLIEEIKKHDKKNEYVIILRKYYFNRLKFPKNWKKVEVDVRHYSFKEQLVLPAVAIRERADVFHIPHFNVPLFYFGNLIVTLHDTLMHRTKTLNTTTLPIPIFIIKRLGYKVSFWKAVFASCKIIVPSNIVKEDIVKKYKIVESKIKVINEGVNKSVFKARKGNRVNNILRKYGLKQYEYFIYSGNTYPHKNIRIVIEAISILNRSDSTNILFGITSSRDVFTEKLIKEIKRDDMGRYVKILGFVPDDDLAILLRYSIAFVYPSLSEGFGLQGLEAMASGTLVIGSDIDVFREIYKDNIYYFNPYDRNTLVEQMNEVLALPEEERKQRIKKGIHFVKKYSWSKMAKETIKVYESCISL